MTVSEFYSFSIRPKSMMMDFSNKEELIGELSEYCSDIQYIAIHMNEVEAYQKAEIKIEVKEGNIEPVREILKTRGLEKQIKD